MLPNGTRAPDLPGKRADSPRNPTATRRTIEAFADVPEAELPTFLWLTPVFESETYHGYDALDFRKVAQRVGGEEALRVDGYRLDHAIGPPLLFWTELRAATKRSKADAFTVGEATVGPGKLRHRSWHESA